MLVFQVKWRVLLTKIVFLLSELSAKSTKCVDDGLITQAIVQGVVSNTRGCSVCHGDGATKNKSIVHMGGIGQGKGGLDQCKRVHQRSLGLCLEQGKAQRKVCSNKAASNRRQNGVWPRCSFEHYLIVRATFVLWAVCFGVEVAICPRVILNIRITIYSPKTGLE